MQSILWDSIIPRQAAPEVLDRAVLRILTAKFRMGLFENPYALDGGDLAGVYFEEQDKEVSLASANSIAGIQDAFIKEAALLGVPLVGVHF